MGLIPNRRKRALGDPSASLPALGLRGVPGRPEDPPAARSGMRLVRLRLALALISAAILPLALAAPLIFELGQERQAAPTAVEVETARARVDDHLMAVEAALVAARGDGLDASASGKPHGDVARLLDGIADVAPGIVSGTWLLAPDGDPLVARPRPDLATGQAAPLPATDARAVIAASRRLALGETAVLTTADGAGLYLQTPLDGPVKARRVVLARLSLGSLLATAGIGLHGSPVVVRGSDETEEVIGSEPALTAGAHPLFDSAATASALRASGFEDWSIRLVPQPLHRDYPRELILFLLALEFVAIGIVVWLARQVVRPAEQIEGARTRLHALYESARLDALQDALTGLGNHRAFMEEFERQIEESLRYDGELALLLLDLDDFKLVNDSAGHAVGDKLLVEVGRLLESVMRRSDRAFRIGGDEFAVLMPHTDAETAVRVGRRLLALCSEPRRESVFPRPFTFSAGISACPTLSRSRSELFEQADAALLDGKRRGRTTVSVYDPQRSGEILDQQARAELSAKVARVVAARSLRPVYQPVVDLRTGRVMGFEGLVRPTADAPFDNPGALFAAAEAGGRTTELDFACIETVLAGMGKLAPDQTLSINLSPRSLEAAEFNTGTLVALLARRGIEPRRITIELTEREAVEDIERLRTVISGCQAAGFRVAVDDVGAGNAGLRLLSQIHFDIVKIDLSLVQSGEQQESSLEVLRALVDLAARWGALVVAEGVETPGQLAVIRSLGMTAAQGYLLGRPTDDPSARSVDLAALLAPAEGLGSVADAARRRPTIAPSGA